MKKNILVVITTFLSLTALAGCVKNTNKNSSSTNSSTESIEDTSTSSEDTSSEEIPNYEVTKEEYLKSFENFEKETNYTINFESNISGHSPEIFANIDCKTKQIQKRAGLKASLQDTWKQDCVVDNDDFNDMYNKYAAITDEDKLEIYKEYVDDIKSAGFTIIEQAKDYLHYVMNYVPDTYYVEYIENDPLFVYDYVYKRAESSFIRSKRFYDTTELYEESVSNILLKLMNNENMYNLLSYDETKETYTTEIEFTESLDVLMAGMDYFYADNIEEATASISFIDKQLTGIEIVMQMDSSVTINKKMVIENRGSSSSTLPTNITTCSHETTSYIIYDWNDKYHFQKCDYCEEVLDYEEHEMVLNNKICKDCGYCNEAENVYQIDLEDEHMRSHVSYYSDEKDGLIDYIKFNHMYWDSDKNAYVAYCDEDCGLMAVEEYSEYYDETNPCIYVYEYRYKLIDTKNDNKVLKEIVEYSYEDDHSFSYDIEDEYADDPCKTTYKGTCSKCGLEISYTRHDHNIQNAYSSEGCSITCTQTCSDCDYEKESTIKVHKDLVINEPFEDDPTAYSCHCNTCNEDFIYRFGSYEYEDEFAHEVDLYTEDGHLIDWIRLEHEFDENNVCIHCGYDKSESNCTTEKFSLEYESMDYLYVIYEPDGGINSFKFSYFYDVDDSDENHVVGQSSISDYRFTIDTLYDSENQCIGSILRIYKGDELIKEIA